LWKPDEVYSLPPVPVFPTTSARDFSYALAATLGLNAEKDVDIQMFDTVTDGFNLSIKADVLIKNEIKNISSIHRAYLRNLSMR